MELQDPTSLLLLFGQRDVWEKLTTLPHFSRTSLSSNGAHCLSKLKLLLMLSELDEALGHFLISFIMTRVRHLSSLVLLIDVLLLNNCTLDVDSAVVRSSLFKISSVNFHPVAADVTIGDRGGSGVRRFRSMFCSFAFRHSDISSLSLCECVVCSPPKKKPCEETIILSSSRCEEAGVIVNRKSCQQGVGRRWSQQNVSVKRLPLRSRSVNVANFFLLSFSLVLISLSEWLVLHCYHRKEFRRKGC